MSILYSFDINFLSLYPIILHREYANLLNKLVPNPDLKYNSIEFGVKTFLTINIKTSVSSFLSLFFLFIKIGSGVLGVLVSSQISESFFHFILR